MKRMRDAALSQQFLHLSFWLTTTIVTGVMYRMLVFAIFFEFPTVVLLSQSVTLIALIQLGKTLFPAFCKSWNTSIDLKALPASLLFSTTIFMDYSFLKETSSSRLLQLLVSPVIAFVVLNSSGSQRAKIGRKFPVVMSLLSVVFSFNSMNVADLTTDGVLFGAGLLVSNVASLLTLRRYLETNTVTSFIFSHSTFVSGFLFLFELYQHDVHRLYLYVQMWQLPYFYPVFFSFFLASLLSLISFCHVITQFDLTTVAISLNTKCTWQFVIANFVFRNIAMKDYFNVDYRNYVSTIATLLLNVAVFWMDSRKRAENDYHLRSLE